MGRRAEGVRERPMERGGLHHELALRCHHRPAAPRLLRCESNYVLWGPHCIFSTFIVYEWMFLSGWPGRTKHSILCLLSGQRENIIRIHVARIINGCLMIRTGRPDRGCPRLPAHSLCRDTPSTRSCQSHTQTDTASLHLLPARPVYFEH